jgi:hypothetical protein
LTQREIIHAVPVQYASKRLPGIHRRVVESPVISPDWRVPEAGATRMGFVLVSVLTNPQHHPLSSLVRVGRVAVRAFDVPEVSTRKVLLRSVEATEKFAVFSSVVGK